MPRKIMSGIILLGLLSLFGRFNVQANEVLHFQDDFSNLERSREIWKSQYGFPTSYLYLTNGVMRMDVLNTGTGITAGSESWSNYVFSVKIRFIERAEDDNHAGFNIRGGVLIIGSENCISYNIANVTTETAKGLDAEKRKVPLDDGKWHYFRFICKGDSVNVWADGEEIGTIKRAPEKGGIGLYSHKCRVEFDEVSVAGLE